VSVELTPESHETLGARLRAARLGFRALPRGGVYLRVADEGAGFRLTLVPFDAMRNYRSRPRAGYRVWWPDMTEELTALVERHLCGGARLVRVRRRVSLLVDNDGGLRGGES